MNNYLILFSILIDLYDSYMVTEKIRTEASVLQFTRFNGVHFLHSDFPPRNWGGGYVLPRGHPHDSDIILTPCSCREAQYTFSKPLYSQFKLPISPSPDAIWEAHRSLSTSVASDCDAETKWSWKIVPKPRNGACHFQHLNSWTVETYCIAACYVGLIVWESWPK